MKKLIGFVLMFIFFACKDAKIKTNKISAVNDWIDVEVIDNQYKELNKDDLKNIDELVEDEKDSNSASIQSGILSVNLYFLSKNFQNGLEICDLDTQVRFRIFSEGIANEGEMVYFDSLKYGELDSFFSIFAFFPELYIFDFHILESDGEYYKVELNSKEFLVKKNMVFTFYSYEKFLIGKFVELNDSIKLFDKTSVKSSVRSFEGHTSLDIVAINTAAIYLDYLRIFTA